jgi:ATP-dependent Lon protease
MRDYRDAKAMAHTLRDALAAKHHKITVGESLELVAHLFGVADWNTLSATIKTSATSNNSDPEPAPPISGSGGPGKVQFARTTEVTLQRTLALAVNRNQEEATVLHLLFALTDDPDAAAVMKACNAAPAAIKEALDKSGEIGGAPAGLLVLVHMIHEKACCVVTV